MRTATSPRERRRVAGGGDAAARDGAGAAWPAVAPDALSVRLRVGEKRDLGLRRGGEKRKRAKVATHARVTIRMENGTLPAWKNGGFAAGQAETAPPPFQAATSSSLAVSKAAGALTTHVLPSRSQVTT